MGDVGEFEVRYQKPEFFLSLRKKCEWSFLGNKFFFSEPYSCEDQRG